MKNEGLISNPSPNTYGINEMNIYQQTRPNHIAKLYISAKV